MPPGTLRGERRAPGKPAGSQPTPLPGKPLATAPAAHRPSPGRRPTPPGGDSWEPTRTNRTPSGPLPISKPFSPWPLVICIGIGALILVGGIALANRIRERRLQHPIRKTVTRQAPAAQPAAATPSGLTEDQAAKWKSFEQELKARRAARPSQPETNTPAVSQTHALPPLPSTPAAPSNPVPQKIRFKIDRLADVSLGVHEDGQRERLLVELLRSKRLKAGTYSVFWDGRDREGVPVEPGTYRWKLAASPDVDSEPIQHLSGHVTVHTQALAAAWSGTGLTGTYFRGTDFQDAAFSRVDGGIRFGATEAGPAWNLSAPDIAEAPFSVRWEGAIEAPISQEYRFSAAVQGGRIAMWVNSRPVLSATNLVSKAILLRGAVKIPIRIEFVSSGEAPAVQVNWESPVHERQSIPAQALYPWP